MGIESSSKLEPIRRKNKPQKDYLRNKVNEALEKAHEKHFKHGSHRRLSRFDEKQKKIKQAVASVEKSGFPTEYVYGSGLGGRLDALMTRLEGRMKDDEQKKENNLDSKPYNDLAKELEKRYKIRKQRLDIQRRNLPININTKKIYDDIYRSLEKVNTIHLRNANSELAKQIRRDIRKKSLDIRDQSLTAEKNEFDNDHLNIRLKRKNDSITDNPLQLSIPISGYGEIKSQLGKTLKIDVSQQNEGVFMKELFERNDKNGGVSQIEFLAQFLFPDIKREDLKIFYPNRNSMQIDKGSEPRLKLLDLSDGYKADAMTSKQVFKLFEKGFEEIPIILVKDRVGNVLLELTFSYINNHKLGLINLRMPEQRNKDRLLGMVNKWVGNL